MWRAILLRDGCSGRASAVRRRGDLLMEEKNKAGGGGPGERWKEPGENGREEGKEKLEADE